MVGDLSFVTSHCCEPATNLYGIDKFPIIRRGPVFFFFLHTFALCEGIFPYWSEPATNPHGIILSR
jgi:hypothetical protein